jgi:hypothetical protein
MSAPRNSAWTLVSSVSRTSRASRVDSVDQVVARLGPQLDLGHGLVDERVGHDEVRVSHLSAMKNKAIATSPRRRRPEFPPRSSRCRTPGVRRVRSANRYGRNPPAAPVRASPGCCKSSKCPASRGPRPRPSHGRRAQFLPPKSRGRRQRRRAGRPFRPLPFRISPRAQASHASGARHRFGVAPICRVLSQHGLQGVAPAAPRGTIVGRCRVERFKPVSHRPSLVGIRP